MRNVFILAAAGLFLSVAPYAADAKGGASQNAPGQQFRTNGPVSGTHGASGYSPGQQYRTNGAVAGTHGASGYAPGHTK